MKAGCRPPHPCDDNYKKTGPKARQMGCFDAQPRFWIVFLK